MANICIAGLWHQAMVLAAGFADLGHQVVGVGDEESVAAGLNQGRTPLFEPEIPELIMQNLKAGRLKFTTDYSAALRGAEFAYLSIDTPVNADDSSDLSSIFAAARNIGRGRSGPLTLVVTSQVPVGTTELIAAAVREQNLALGLNIAYVPEFLRLGTALETFRKADRFVIGADDPDVAQRIAALYRPLNRPILFTGLRAAEMGKHACNAYLANSISFINEIANLCEALGADATEVARIMKADRRVGAEAFLSPGLGFAGGTLGREIRALQKFGLDTGLPTAMMDAVATVNQSRILLVRQRLERQFGLLQGLKIGVLGLTYKPGTSTLRRAISLDIIADLVRHGAQVVAFDPLARIEGLADLPAFELVDSPYLAAQGADALVLLTEWTNMLHDLDLPRLRSSMRNFLFIDTRNLFDPERVRQAGLLYSGIGRPRPSVKSDG